MNFTFTHNGEPRAVSVERLPDGRVQATVRQNTYTLKAEPIAGGWMLDFGSERARVYVAAQGRERSVSVAGNAFTLSLPEPRPARRGAGSSGGDLTAQMPGQVMQVLVQPGDAVERGQLMIILEAMKMELRVTAPGAGRVRQVLVQPGDVVERGQRLVELQGATD